MLTAHTRDCLVVHNTVHDPTSRLRRLIWVQDDNDGLLVANNLLSGPDILNTGTGPSRCRTQRGPAGSQPTSSSMRQPATCD